MVVSINRLYVKTPGTCDEYSESFAEKVQEYLNMGFKPVKVAKDGFGNIAEVTLVRP